MRVSYGRGGELRPSGQISDAAPNELIIVSGDKLSFFDTGTKNVKQSELLSNVDFHLNPNSVTAGHQCFIAGLIRVPDDVISCRILHPSKAIYLLQKWKKKWFPETRK